MTTANGQINGSEIIARLKARGIDAEVEMTGGGVATIYAGPSYTDRNGDPRRAAVAGPGDWRPGTATFYAEEFLVGPDDDGMAEPRQVTTLDEAVEAIAFYALRDLSAIDETIARVSALARAIVKDVEAHVAEGTIKGDVETFGDLHDYVDANTLGETTLAQVSSTYVEKVIILNIAQGIVGLWIEAGGLNTIPAAAPVVPQQQYDYE